MDKITKKNLIRQYKENPPPMGVFLITNLVNNKKFLGSSVNIPAIFNRIKSELKVGKHSNKALMEDWLKYGEENFKFEILDQLENKSDPNSDLTADLKTLHKLWAEKISNCEYN